MKKVRILVADDETIAYESVSDWYEQNGGEVR